MQSDACIYELEWGYIALLAILENRLYTADLVHFYESNLKKSELGASSAVTIFFFKHKDFKNECFLRKFANTFL